RRADGAGSGGRLGVDLRADEMKRALCVVAAALATHAAAADPRFSAEDIDKGHAQFDRTCAQCHGRNMVNSGTTVYDLRRFPVDDPDRFFHSVTEGKGN